MKLHNILSFAVVVAVVVGVFTVSHKTSAQSSGPVKFDLALTPLATANGLAGVSASAVIDVQNAWVTVNMKLPDGYRIPDNVAFEAWLFDGPGIINPANNSFLKDQKYGPRYANRTIAALTDAAPYWLTLGALTSDGKGNLSVALKMNNYNFAPYEVVGITIETDGNQVPWDPRPGSTILSGRVADGKPTDPVDIGKLVGAMPNLNTSQGVSLKLTKLGDRAGLKITGKAFVFTDSAAGEVDVKLPANVKVPDGTVLEAWVADGGKLGNFGPSHARLSDNKLGPAFNNAYLSAIADAIPFATSLGTLKPGSDGSTYTVQAHWQKYAFRVYNIVMVTLESDGDTGNWNPRPGTPVLVGAITPETDLKDLMAMPGDEDMTAPSDMGRALPAPAATVAPTAAK